MPQNCPYPNFYQEFERNIFLVSIFFGVTKKYFFLYLTDKNNLPTSTISNHLKNWEVLLQKTIFFHGWSNVYILLICRICFCYKLFTIYLCILYASQSVHHHLLNLYSTPVLFFKDYIFSVHSETNINISGSIKFIILKIIKIYLFMKGLNLVKKIILWFDFLANSYIGKILWTEQL